MDVTRLTDDELESNMARIHNQFVHLDHELEILGIESSRRYFLEESVALEGLATVTELRPRGDAQLRLFDHPDDAA